MDVLRREDTEDEVLATEAGRRGTTVAGVVYEVEVLL